MHARIELDDLLKRPDLEPIPGYRLIEPLGKGGFGEVWKCEAPGGLFKAIKFVCGDAGMIGRDRSGADQELRSLQHIKSIRHPFLLSMDRVEHIGEELVIVMELADKSLYDLLVEYKEAGEKAVPREELLCYMRETAEVLDLMNLEYGLEHLDIKPQNLFLVRNHIKVADFGLVNSLAEIAGQNSASFQLGAITPLYASPESFQGKITVFSDQYSLGVVYHELLTGFLPFTGKNFRQLAMQHCGAEPNLNLLPEEDRPIIARALAKDPRARFPSCMALVQALITGEMPVEGSETGAVNRTVTVFDMKLPEKPRTASIQRPTKSLKRNSDPLGQTRKVSAAPTPTTEAPQCLDDYQFLDCLGRGPLGEMWKTEAPDGSLRLVKLVNTFSQGGLFGEDDPLTRLQTLRHPGLQALTIVPREPARLALISDMNTESLATRLQVLQAQRQPGIPRHELLRYLKQAAHTLDELQRIRQLQHLGLNPRSLLLVDECVLLADFGLVMILWMPAGQQVGQINARYSAPELFDQRVTPSCDQYSLALIYHEMLTGYHVFGNQNQRLVNQQRLSGKFSMDFVPGADREILTQALSPDPQKRFRSCTEMILALERAVPSEMRGPEESGWMPKSSGSIRSLDESPKRSAVSQNTAANLRQGMTPLMHQTVAELVAEATGNTQIREYRQVRYLLEPDKFIEYQCSARILPGTLQIKLPDFVNHWQATLLDAAGDGFVLQVALKSSFWQRCLGRQSALEMCAQLRTPSCESPISDVLIRITPTPGGTEQGAHALEKTGPMLLDSFRTYFQPGPDRRSKIRLPFARRLQILPILADQRAGEPLVCQGKDITLDGLGLYMPCKPTRSFMMVQLERGTRKDVVSVPVEVVRAQPCADGRYEVGLRFLNI